MATYSDPDLSLESPPGSKSPTQKTIDPTPSPLRDEITTKKFESLCASSKHQEMWSMIDEIPQPLRQNSWLKWFEPFWWGSLNTANVKLRRRDASDIDFLRSRWRDDVWLDQFHPSAKPLPSSDRLLHEILSDTFNHSILKNKSIHWVGEIDDQAAALVSIVNISLDNRRGEFLMGVVPETSSFSSARLALLALKFWFQIANMQKLTSLVRFDNKHSIQSTLHLGFQKEGLLKEHLLDKTTNFVDLYCFGLTRELAFKQFNSSLFRRLSRLNTMG